MALRPRESVLKISPYQPGEGTRNVIKLASNENPFGVSENIKQVLADAISRGETFSRYPDDGAAIIKQALTKQYQVDAKHLMFGNGSSELLGRLIRTYAEAGDEVLYPEYGFLMYSIYIHAAGAQPVQAREKNYTTDVDALLERVNEKTKIVILANPNNPTGTMVPLNELKRLHATLPDSVLLIIDNAYIEFTNESVTDYIEFALSAKNIAVTHTFSKVYGLASTRVGWGYASEEIVDAVWRTHDPFNVNALAQIAAVAALEDQEFVRSTVLHTAKLRDDFSQQLRGMGLDVLPSYTNFVCVKFPGGAEQAAAANIFLRDKKIFVRPIGGYNLPECLRISIGLENEMRLCAESMKAFLNV